MGRQGGLDTDTEVKMTDVTDPAKPYPYNIWSLCCAAALAPPACKSTIGPVLPLVVLILTPGPRPVSGDFDYVEEGTNVDLSQSQELLKPFPLNCL